VIITGPLVPLKWWSGQRALRVLFANCFRLTLPVPFNLCSILVYTHLLTTLPRCYFS